MHWVHTRGNEEAGEGARRASAEADEDAVERDRARVCVWGGGLLTGRSCRVILHTVAWRGRVINTEALYRVGTETQAPLLFLGIAGRLGTVHINEERNACTCHRCVGTQGFERSNRGYTDVTTSRCVGECM